MYSLKIQIFVFCQINNTMFDKLNLDSFAMWIFALIKN